MSYYEGLNEKLAAALPDARHVLEIGCASGRLGAAFKSAHPAANWHGVDCNAAALAVAATRLDGVFLRDLNREPLGDVGDAYDCVAMGDALEHLGDPERLLIELTSLTTPDAQLVICVPNSTHISIVERLLVGDLSYDDAGLLDRTHLRMFSPSSLLKLLLDSGWWPEIVDRYRVNHGNPRFEEKLVESASLLGVPAETSRTLLRSYQLIVNCRKLPPAGRSHGAAPFSVVVPVSNETQFALNVMASPGLRDIAAEIIPIRGQPDAATAFRSGAQRARHDWVIFCHQDAYFPRGSGAELATRLAAVPADERARSLIGFIGIGQDRDGNEFPAGMVLDRFRRLDWPAADIAVSLDEFAVVMARDTALAVDETLGWHLWATELCLQARQRQFPSPRILRLPLFHNSVTGFTLPPAFHASAEKLAAKYPDTPRITSLCGTIKDER